MGRTDWTLTSRGGLIDLHTHLLPGIDDGASDLDASVEMARAAVEGGVEQLVATPHVSRTYPNDPHAFGRRVAEVQSALDAAGVPLRVHRGAEVNHAALLDLTDEDLSACTIGGGAFLLIEPSMSGPMPFIERAVGELQQKGFRILLAHPERIHAFQRNIGLLERLVDQGCLSSVTASSVSGHFGGSVMRFTKELFAHGLVHNLASDAHDARFRSPALRPALERAVEALPALEPWLPYLTEDVPRAILAGETPPGTAPVIESRRGVLRRLRGR
jgi:protein-tyrosine phosphatase